MKTGRLSWQSAVSMLGIVLFVTGCTAADGLDEDSGGASGRKITVRATTETRTSAQGDVRTTLGSSYEVLWSPEDSFMVYTMNGNLYSAFAIENGAGTTSASFTGPALAGNSFVAVYGANSYCVSGTASFIAMPEQRYRKDGFSDNVNPMLAYTDDLEKGLSFSNVMGILELNVTGTKTVDRITVSCEGMALSGRFFLAADLSDFTLTSDAQSAASEVSLVNIGETLDASTPKRFNVVVPPGTYENLRIRIVNADGTYVERTAPEPITVARNQIVPLMGLVDGDEAQQTPVRITVEPYAWYGCNVYADMVSAEYEMFVLMVATESGIEQWKLQNPGKNESDMIISNGDLYDRNIAFAYEEKAGETLHIYALVMNANYEPVGPVSHALFKVEPPYDDSLFAQACIMENTMTETAVSIACDCTANVQKVKAILLQDQSVQPDMDYYLFYTCAYPQYEVSVSAGTGRLEITDMMPGRDYMLLYVAESSDGKISPLQSLEFSTPEHVASDALVTISENSVEDIMASFNIDLSSSAVSYKAMSLTEQRYNELAGEGLADIVAMSMPEPIEDPVYTVTDLSPETDYVLVAVAYDANGVYGSLSVLPFRTTPYIAVEDPAYDAFIGEWSVDYVDYNTGAEVTDGFRVNISPGVEGKTFLIDGLVGGARNPVVAKFANNGLRLDAGMNLYSMSETSCVVLGFITDVGVFVNTFMCLGSVNGDTITFAGYDMPYEFMGFVFYVYDMQTGEYPGYVEPVVQNPVFRRVAAQ